MVDTVPLDSSESRCLQILLFLVYLIERDGDLIEFSSLTSSLYVLLRGWSVD